MFWRSFKKYTNMFWVFEIHHKKYFIIVCALISITTTSFAGNVQLTQLQLSNTRDSLRINLILTQKTNYKIFTLPAPDRLVVDLSNTRKNLVIQQPSSKFVREIRVGHPKPNVLRLVFNLARPVKFKVFAYSVKHSQQQKIMVDVYATDKKIQKTTETPKISKRKHIIVIDPGHGGKDAGAVGSNRSYEKNVVLAISKKLANLINKQPNFKAVLTRDSDYYVTLRGRLQVARLNKADMFVAIHADSYFNDIASGASVYALSQRGATSEAARWLAKRENYSELDEVDLNELNNQNHFLRYVMIDLAQTATISDSLRLGTSLIGSLQEVARLRYPRVEQAPFMVLKSPDIPSVLVEVGFISNPKEEMRLRDPVYQNKLAKALLEGILRFSSSQI